MDFRFSAEEDAYREQVRAWLSENIPSWWRETRDREVSDQDTIHDKLRKWHCTLYEAGYVGTTWPREYGGWGRTHVENAILQEELSRSQAPTTVNGLGIGLAGPAIIHHGNEAQSKRFLVPMLRADEMWCQGYSEPGAGSDLANVQTRAELRGDKYIVNGQKIWTSGAHLADWNFCLVRTDPDAKKHDGIGFLLIDMHSSGIEVSPLVQINGAHGFSQVFYTDVEVPSENMVGHPTEGWRVANTVLGYERGAGTLSRAIVYQHYLEELRALAKTTGRNEDAAVRQRMAQAAIDIEVLRLLGLRQLTALAQGSGHGPESSIQKVYYSELNQRLAELGSDLTGAYGQLAARSPRSVENGIWTERDLSTRAVTIFSGTSEIQRNIIAERVLGLPRR